MKELAIHCTIYVKNPDGWDEDSPNKDADKVLTDIGFISAVNGGWEFDYQVYDTEVRDV